MNAPTLKKLASSKARIALIDADSVLYAVALSGEAISKKTGDNEEDEYFQVKSLEDLYVETVSRLRGLVQEVGAEDAIIALTPTMKSFRYHLLNSYKANRATFRRPVMLAGLQNKIRDERPFGVIAVKGLEADDVCGISSTQLQKAKLREPIVVSIDKDLRQIPGLLYSWMHAARTDTVGQLEEISAFDADRHHLYQTLVGDVIDNYTGCPNVGPKRANKLLDDCIKHSGGLDWEWIKQAFEKRGCGIEYALTQARVARILRDTDWNAKTKEIVLWSPPTSGLIRSSSSTACDTTTMPQHVPAKGPRKAGQMDGTPQDPPDASTLLRLLPDGSVTIH